MRFFVGLHQPSDANHFDSAFISVNRLQGRKSNFAVKEWILDSGAFTTIAKYGYYPHSAKEYAKQIARWKTNGKLLAAVSQDYMCEPEMLQKTGLSVKEHQRKTIERYDKLLACNTGVYILPVLQGYVPDEYAAHVRAYKHRLAENAWVGLGSVCKRNRNPLAIRAVISRVLAERPDLRLHGFGVKLTSLLDGSIRQSLYSADSMAWSFAARKAGRNQNDWNEARKFVSAVSSASFQPTLFGVWGSV